jgi:hypothetical protein
LVLTHPLKFHNVGMVQFFHNPDFVHQARLYAILQSLILALHLDS